MAARPDRRRLDRARLPGVRAAAQLLHRPAAMRHPADVARAICGVQAQDLRAGRLAFRARSPRLTAGDVDRARTEERSLLRAWAMRNTAHLLAADDAAWLLPLFEPGLEAFARRRLPDLGLDARAQDRALAEIRAALASHGPLTRSALVERLAAKGIAVDDSIRVHLFRLATATGLACLGPDEGGQTALVLAEDWLGPRPRHDRDAALRELARRYLAAFGPATETDFAGWSGLGLRDVRAGLRGIAGEIAEVGVGEESMWVPRRRARRAAAGVVRLLGAWDTYLMGYRDRGFMASPPEWRRIMPGGGMLAATVIRDGLAIGTWRSRRTGPGRRIDTELFAGPDPAIRSALAAEAADVARFEAG